MKKLCVFLVFLLSIILLSCKIIYKENFDKDSWEKRWVYSKAKNDYGKFSRDHGEWYGDKKNKGIKTTQDSHFYAISSSFSKEFSNEDKDLYIQFSIKFEQGIDCGGGYIKILPKDLKQEEFKGESKYYIMFGPDICGSQTKKVHLIFNYKGKNLDWKKSLNCETDKLTHIYTAVIKKDLTYEVHIDGVKKESGKLLDDWDFLPPKEIPDPNSKKPDNWVDEKEILDPNDKKPVDWDQPKTIKDPDAKKPEDWDEDEDGTWEAPQVDNPKYKGEWVQKKIPNPKYKGEWVAPKIENPDYFEDNKVHIFDDMKYVGIEVWQVKSGSIFDNILITDSEEELKEHTEIILNEKKKEKEMFDEIEGEKRKKEEEERNKRMEEDKKKREEENAKKEKENAKKEKEDKSKKEEEKDEDEDEDEKEDEIKKTKEKMKKEEPEEEEKDEL